MKERILTAVLVCSMLFFLTATGYYIRKSQEKINERILTELIKKCQNQNWTGYVFVGGCTGLLCDEWAADCKVLKGYYANYIIDTTNRATSTTLHRPI